MRDVKKSAAVGLGSFPSTFADAEWNPDRGSPDLVRQTRMATREIVTDPVGDNQEFDRTLVHIQSLITHHGNSPRIRRRSHPCPRCRSGRRGRLRQRPTPTSCGRRTSRARMPSDPTCLSRTTPYHQRSLLQS